jgi:hypothetical protein
MYVQQRMVTVINIAINILIKADRRSQLASCRLFTSNITYIHHPSKLGSEHIDRLNISLIQHHQTKPNQTKPTFLHSPHLPLLSNNPPLSPLPPRPPITPTSTPTTPPRSSRRYFVIFAVECRDCSVEKKRRDKE